MKTHSRSGFILFAAVCSLAPALAAPVQLRPAQPLQASAANVGPASYSIPVVTDWNGDGRKDLLVGYRYADKIAVYLNAGTDAQPQFTNYYNLKAAGVDIVVTGSGCGAPCPWVCDFDGDGKRDLLVGDGMTGKVWFFRNTNTDQEPILEARVALQVGTSDLVVPSAYRATPCVNDWDEDGLPDLLCGEGNGNVYFYKNTNTRSAPIYAAAVKLKAAGADLYVGARSVVRVFDWDGDGLKDLVCSSDSGVYWCRNTNRDAAVILQAPETIKAPVAGVGLTPIVTSSRMRLDLADWNNDGAIDLLVGDMTGKIYLFQGYPFAVSAAAPPSQGQVLLQWNSAPYLTYNVLEKTDLISGAWSTNGTTASGGNTTTWTNLAKDHNQFFKVQVAQ